MNAEVKLGDFDPLVVHHRDPVSKRITKVNPFRVIVEKGARFYEWPKGSSNLWFENRHPAGRLDDGKIVRGAEHVAYQPPVTEDENIARENMTLKQEMRKVQEELAAIKREKELDADFPKVKMAGNKKKPSEKSAQADSAE